MANKKISQQTNNITTLNDDVWIRAIENQSTIPTDGYIKATQFNSRSDIITDGVNTFVDVSAGEIIDMKFGIASGNGLTLKNSSDVEIFQINEDGALLINNFYQLQLDGTNLYIGTRDTPASGSGSFNIFGGRQSGRNAIGLHNVGIGTQCFYNITNGDYSTSFGYQSSFNSTNSDYRTTIGYKSGLTGNGSNVVFLGAFSGYYSTDSDKLLIDGFQRANAAAEKTDSLLYGDFDPVPANQLLRINGLLELTQINSGATQVAAGAGPNEVWKTASHATLPDNVLMIGV
jgi:hypothetical protein